MSGREHKYAALIELNRNFFVHLMLPLVKWDALRQKRFS